MGRPLGVLYSMINQTDWWLVENRKSFEHLSVTYLIHGTGIYTMGPPKLPFFSRFFIWLKKNGF